MTFQTVMETGESWLFWRESVWLPPNMTWADVAPVEGVARYTRCVPSKNLTRIKKVAEKIFQL